MESGGASSAEKVAQTLNHQTLNPPFIQERNQAMLEDNCEDGMRRVPSNESISSMSSFKSHSSRR